MRLGAQRQYLRSLSFGFIRDNYNKTLGNSTTHRKATALLYFFPALFAFGVATQNYVVVSFGVYLKYQAFVDSFYLKKKQTNTLSIIKDAHEELMNQI